MAAEEQDVPAGVDPRDVGLIEKYRVYKWVPCKLPTCTPDHKILEEVDHQVFVLDPTKDLIAREAIKRYLQIAAVRGYSALAEDLRNWMIDLQKAELEGEMTETLSDLEKFQAAMNDEGESR